MNWQTLDYEYWDNGRHIYFRFTKYEDMINFIAYQRDDQFTVSPKLEPDERPPEGDVWYYSTRVGVKYLIDQVA